MNLMFKKNNETDIRNFIIILNGLLWAYNQELK